MTKISEGPVAAQALAGTFGGAIVTPGDALPIPVPAPPLSGWTSHGHAMRGVPQVGEPQGRERCGGPALCQTCGREEVAATAPAPPLADDVAALRALIGTAATVADVEASLAILDRLAGAVPQRATSYGLELWQHACGMVDHAGPVQPHPDQCDRCRLHRPGTSEPWQPLYILGEG